MKVFYLLFLSLCLFHVDAQRRSVKSEVAESDSAPKTARRGRARFVVPPEQQQLEEPSKRHEPLRRVAVRKRPEVYTEAIPARRTYEVEEIVDETPLFKKNGKTRVFTETKFEAPNAPPTSLFQPSTTESLDDVIKSIGSDILDPTTSSVAESPNAPSSSETASIEMSASEFTKVEDEISKVPPETTTPLTSPRTTRRSNGRSRSNNGNGAASTTIAPRATRTRPTRATRAPKKAEEQTPAPARTAHRGSRRRTEVPETRAIAAAETVEQPLRSRTGRKIVRVEGRPEKISNDLPSSHRTSNRRNFEAPSRNVELPSRNVDIPSRNVDIPSRNVEIPSRIFEIPTREVPARKVEISRNVEQLSRNVEIPSRNVEIPTRGRFRTRSRDIPPIIDESKLEVLPLFERESKTVKPVRRVVSRRRTFNSAEEVETSATENDVKVAQKPKQSVVVETRTESSFKRRKVTSKPVTKESVVSRITEVTSKRTITRRKPSHKTSTTPKTTTARKSNDVKLNNSRSSDPKLTTASKSSNSKLSNSKSNSPKLNNSKPSEPKLNEPKLQEPKFVPRGSKKAETNLAAVKTNKSSLSSSEEEIDESDNYPEQFKALLQAKKQKKESRSQHRLVTASPIVTKTTEKVTTSSTTSSTTTTKLINSSEANRQLEDSENELDSSSLRSARRRNPSTTEKTTRTTRKNKVIRSTTALPLSAKDHRFHAKIEEVTLNPVKPRSFSSKPARGLYSSRKTKESHPKNKISPGQIPSPKKSNRYSSRYRNDASSRTALRTSTNAPAYLPTIPTITPPTTSVKSPVALEDKDLGVEVISFDDPVNTVPSANLVSGEYLASSTENYLTSPLVQAAQTKTTEKPVSIIERIINSITAISTTEAPDTTKTTTPEPETNTKESAILKLATKKATKLDKTVTTQRIPTVTVTSERPTTIIERILSSLSAIQADNTTDTKTLKSKQVGTNFNTISSPSTTPLTRVTKSTLDAQFSTSVNPLTVLDEISNEQTLQKRTIGKLLALLNTLTSTPVAHPQLVVVTPKATSYVVGTSGTTTTIEPVFSNTITTTLAPQISTTTEPTTTTPAPATPTTTGQLFTSAGPHVQLNARIRPEDITKTPTTTPIPETTTPLTTTSTQAPTLTSTEAVPTTTTLNSNINEIGALPLSFELSIPNSVTESSTISSTDFSSSVGTSFPTTEFAVNTETAYVFPSTIPSLINFEVSPGSVSIFSANDLFNAITPDDSPSTTVTIYGKTNTPETSVTTESSTESTTSIQTTTPENNASTQSPTTTTTTITTTTGTGTTVNVESRVGSTESSENSTVAVTTEAPSTTETVATNNTTQDISSNVIDTTGSPEKSNNQTSTVSPPTNSSVQLSSRSGQSGRAGRLLNVVQDPVQNSIENSTVKDYYIFAVLNNNTVLRKRPSRFPTKDTPFLIVGVYPNNTIVRKFPNGSLVPMEPVIRVSGFDTRENPPPLPEITSNQVTPDQGRRPDNKTLQTVEQNTIPPLEANPLSVVSANNATETTTSSTVAVQANPLSISSSSSTESSTSSTTSRNSSANIASTTPGTTTTSTASTTALPSLTEILNGRTVQAFNSIINISDLTKTQTLDVDPKSTTPISTTTLSNKILEDTTLTTRMRAPTTTQQPITSTTTMRTTTTMVPTVTTTMPPTTTTRRIQTTTTSRRMTVTPTTVPTTTKMKITTTLPPKTTTELPSTTTFFPSFLTTLFSTLRPRRLSTTQSPFTIVTPATTTIQSTLAPQVEVRGRSGDLATAGTTRRTVSTTPLPTTTLLSTLPSTTRSRRRSTTTIPTTTMPSTLPPSTTTVSSARSARRSTTTKPPDVTTKKIRKLTEQQRKELETIAQLEKEQEAILKQLAFLTNLNFANIKPTTDKNNVANRIIALAVERDKEARQKATTTPPSSETQAPERTRQAKKISPSNDQTLEDLVKQINVATPQTLTSPYGKSNDAIIAQLLKEQGIGPTTPEALGDVYSQTTTTTRRPRTTTQRQPGPLMQSLTWLLNVLAPPPTTTKRPRPKSKKPKPKPKPQPQPQPQPSQEEILTHQPTHITPVMTPAPPRNIVSALSQADIQKLIKQLEAVQRDPDHNQNLDFSSIKSLQTLLNTEGGVQVSSSGTTGATSRSTTPLPRKEKGRSSGRSRVVKSTTAAPLSVSNSLVDDEEFTTTTRPRVSLPPVRLRPVPGIEDSDTLVRGQLITAAVNVTRAISSFLGTALQGAATGFQTLIGTGSRAVGSLMQVSSNTSSRPG